MKIRGERGQKVKDKSIAEGGPPKRKISIPRRFILRNLRRGKDHLREELLVDDAAHEDINDYGGEQIEHTAVSAVYHAENAVERTVEKGVKRLQKKEKPEEYRPRRDESPPREDALPKVELRSRAETPSVVESPSAAESFPREKAPSRDVSPKDSVPREKPEHVQIKTREAVSREVRVREGPRLRPSESLRFDTMEPQPLKVPEPTMQVQGRKMAVKRAEACKKNMSMEEGSVPQDRPLSSSSDRKHGHISTGKRDHPIAKRTVHRTEKAAGRVVRDTAVGGKSAVKASKSTAKAAKPAAKETGRAVSRTVKTAGRSAKQTVKTADTSVKIAQKTAQVAAKAPQQAVRAVQAVRATAKATAATIKATAKAAVSAIKAAIAAAQELAAAIAAGGWVVIVVVLVICLAGILIASPFGLFMGGEEGGSVSEAVSQLNSEFDQMIQQIQDNNFHDTLDINGTISSWNDVLAVYAVRVDGAVGMMTEENLEILRETFWEMNQISYSVEETEEEKILHIVISSKERWDVADEYDFTDDQRELLEELAKPEYAELFQPLTGHDLTLSPQEIQEILARLPENLSSERKQVILTAYQLLGKVHYFWGGKSLVLGWDSRWGNPTEVWAAGSPSTGTVRPYGLDCSGFMDWVFYNVSGGSYVIGHGGGASAQHSYCADITWDEVIPGDLAFYPGDSHVGIVCGFDESGNVQIIHCASGANNVVVTGKSGFTTVGRPLYYN